LCPHWLSKRGILYRPITEVNLSATSVTNNDLKHIACLSELTRLYLWETNVSNDGLKHLAGLRHLERLYLIGTLVTDEGAAKLQESLPNCQIIH
jgi:internalin A